MRHIGENGLHVGKSPVLSFDAEMTRRGMTYEQLAERLKEIGVEDSAVNIRNKVARGGFSAVFFVQCLHAIGARELRLDVG